MKVKGSRVLELIHELEEKERQVDRMIEMLQEITATALANDLRFVRVRLRRARRILEESAIKAVKKHTGEKIS